MKGNILRFPQRHRKPASPPINIPQRQEPANLSERVLKVARKLRRTGPNTLQLGVHSLELVVSLQVLEIAAQEPELALGNRGRKRALLAAIRDVKRREQVLLSLGLAKADIAYLTAIGNFLK